jgi:hypothetical protein
MLLTVHDAPVPVGVMLGGGAAGLYLFRKLPTGSVQASEDVD